MAAALQRVASAIRNRRLALDLSQRDLAERARLPPETISRLERAQGNPTLHTLETLARALDMDVCELLNPPDPRSGYLHSIVALLADQPPEIQRKALAIIRALLRG